MEPLETRALLALVAAADHPKFVNPLPVPPVIDATDGGTFEINMRETKQWLGLVDEKNKPLETRVWGYGPGRSVSYPGPTFVATRDVPVHVLWDNELPSRHLLPVDTSLHWADPKTNGVPTVTHLHGGHSESASDGLPEAWFTKGFRETGPDFVKKLYTYDNDQQAATLWYHDHALGITRLNVYAGLAGFYLLRDATESGLIEQGVLPGGEFERGIAIQDRSFTSRGQLTLPTTPPELACPLPNGQECDALPNPSAVAEFFGDYILVNGMAWPKLDVEATKYRLRLLNGSDSRFYILEFQNDAGQRQPFLQIGTDNGLLEQAVGLEQLVLAPGERADVIVDFSATGSVTLKNLGPDDPFKGCAADLGPPDCQPSDGDGGTLPPADPDSTGLIMKFNVSLPSSGSSATVKAGTSLNLIPALPVAEGQREVVLFEGIDNYGRLQPLLGTLDDGSLGWFEAITENPGLNDTEIWEIYNVTEDAHPIHLHLVSFQIIDRQVLNEDAFVVNDKPQPQHDGSEGVGGKLVITDPGNLFAGDPILPDANEQGLKDTVQALPGQVTRVIATFDRPGRYVWHCHILSHEDHEMMRPYHVGPMADTGHASAASSVTPRSETTDQRGRFNRFPVVSDPANSATTMRKVNDVAVTPTRVARGRFLRSEFGTMDNAWLLQDRREERRRAVELILSHDTSPRPQELGRGIDGNNPGAHTSGDFDTALLDDSLASLLATEQRGARPWRFAE
jgi:spore coat protein A